MGLFDMFKGDSGQEMTPHLAFAVALIYMMAADGEIQNEEVGHLLSVLGGAQSRGKIGVGANNRDLLDKAVKYVRKKSRDEFFNEVVPLLTDAQKMCMLTNLADSLLSDGQAEPEEQALFERFLNAFGVSNERFKPFFEVIALKNDRSVFVNANHPKNAPDHQVSLSK